MTIEEAGSPNRREEGSSAGCLTLQSGEEVTFQVLQICIYIMSLILLLLIMTNAARARVTLQQIADRNHEEVEQGAGA